MRKPTKREALLKALQKALEKAERAVLAEVAEVLVKGGAFSDERDDLLLAMSDAGITSVALESEQLGLKAERDAKRATHLKGVATRNEIEVNLDKFRSASAANAELKDDGHTEHRNNGDTA